MPRILRCVNCAEYIYTNCIAGKTVACKDCELANTVPEDAEWRDHLPDGIQLAEDTVKTNKRIKADDYHDWLFSLQRNIFSRDSKGFGLIISGLGVTALSAIVGLAMFPPGQYPRIVLAIPGLIAGVLYTYLFGFIFYKLPQIAALVFGFSVAIASAVFIFILVDKL